MMTLNRKKVYMWICLGDKPWMVENFIESQKDGYSCYATINFFGKAMLAVKTWKAENG